jgi:hypothetical protein
MKTEKRLSSIAGSSFQRGADVWIAKMAAGQQLRLAREPENPYDSNAVSVHIFQQHLGYLPRQFAAEIAPLIDGGYRVVAWKSRDPRFAGSGVIIVEWDRPDGPSADAGTDR